jgi:alpha-beta hydrolase superfamily lysophospholipase
MDAGFAPGSVSRDTEVVAANANDPLVTQAMSTRFFSEVYLKAMPAALAAIDRIKVPMLVLVGTGDRLVSPTVGDEFERRATAPRVVKRYEGAYHETYNDLDREHVFADIDAWLAARP